MQMQHFLDRCQPTNGHGSDRRETFGAALGKRPNDLSSKEVSGYVKNMVGVRLDQPYVVEALPQHSGHHAPKRWRLLQAIPDELLPDPLA